MVRLSSQNHTSLRCHQCRKPSKRRSQIIYTGRVRYPGFRVGTEQKEQAKGQPRVACTTLGTKKARESRS